MKGKTILKFFMMLCLVVLVSFPVNAVDPGPPIAVDDSVTVNEDSVNNPIDVLGNDSDLEGDPLAVADVTQASNGSVSFEAATVSYTPNADFSGTDSFTYTLSDGNGGSATATVAVTITNSNDVPTAVDDPVTVNGDSTNNPIDVLANDSDLEGDTLAVTGVTQASNGSVALEASTVSYTPNAGFAGTDSFTYTLSDGNEGSATATVTVTVTSANNVPTAADDSVTVTEDSVNNPIDVLGNDSDLEGDLLAVTDVTQGSSGSVTLEASTVSYTPDADFSGTDSFTYTLSDGNGGSATATVAVTITNSNDVPTAVDDPVTVTGDSTNNPVDVLANDSDLEGDALAVTGVTQASNGSVALEASAVSYTPNAGFTGVDSFTYTISDGNEGSATATVTVTVTSANNVPTAADDAATVTEDSVNNPIAVLANDSDLEGGTLAVTDVTQASNGSVTLEASTVSYTPTADFSGTDSFTYTISDGNGGSATATVTVTVTNSNDAPTAVDDPVTVNEDSANNLVDVLANDSDLEGDTLTVTGVTQASNGSVALEASTVSYTPNADFTGADSFTYTLSDGNGGIDTATVSITVASVNGTIPITTWEELFNVRNNLTADYILMNDLDESSVGYDIYVSGAVNAGGWLPIGEFVPAPATDTLVQGEWDADVSLSTPFSGSFDGDGHTISGLFINRPGDGIQPIGYGIGLFGYVNGGEISNLELVNADITGHRHVGVLAGYTWQTDISNVQISGELYTNHNGGGLVGTARGGSLIQNCSSSADVVGDIIVKKSLRTGGLIGAVHNSTVEDSFTSGRVQGDNYDTGGLAGSIYEGTHITRCHTIGTVYGTGAVGGLIGSTNQASVIVDCYTTGDVIATGREIGGLIGNTNYGTSVAHCYATGNVSGGGLWVGGLIGIVCNGSTVDSSYALGNVTNTSDLSGGLVGHLSTGASIHNSYARGNVAARGGAGGLVGLVDDGLVTESYATGSSAGGYSVGGLIGDSNASTVTDSYWDMITSGLSSTSGGTGLTITQMAQASSFSNWDFADLWQIETDASYPYFSWQGGVNIPYLPTLVALNESVDFQEDSADNVIDARSNDIYNGAGTLEITSATQGAHGSVGVSPEALTYTPQADYNGFDIFYYTVSDGSDQSDTAMVYVRVNSVNDNPTANNDSATVQEDSTDNAFDVLNNDTWLPDKAEALSVTAVSDPANGTAAFTAAGVTYTPDAGFYGADSFTYTISDGNEGSATATVTVTVTNTNDAPTAVDDLVTVNEDSTNSQIDVLANDSDLEGDTLAIAGVTQASNGSVTYTAARASYTPDADFSGTDSFTYTISDGNGGSDTATVAVTVTNINDAPVATDDLATVNEDSISNLISVLANDSDSDSDPLAITDATQGSNGSVTYTASYVSYRPDANFAGTDSFTYTISDGNGGTDTATVTVTVTQSPTSGGGGGGGGGGSGGITTKIPPASTPLAVPTPGAVATTNSTFLSTINSMEIPSVTEGGRTSADISAEALDALLEKAEESDAAGKEDILEVVVVPKGEIEGIEFHLQSADLKKLVTTTEASFKLTSSFITMIFDHEAQKAIDAVNTLDEIVIAAREVKDSELSATETLLVKGRPVYDLTITKGVAKVTSFGEGHATVMIPYEPKVGEDHEAIVVYFRTGQGDLQMVRGHYDAQLKAVVFETNHFSEFVIGYNTVSFLDVSAQAWYKNAVDFIVARGYVSGTGGNRFEPDAQLKRADFVVMLMNTFGSELKKLRGNQQIGNFDDAGNTYYTDELLTAKRLGLINGTGQNLFEPELGITRQEMMVILHKMLNAIGEVPAPTMTLQLVSFNDADEVADWAEEAIASFVNSGIVSGDDHNLNPEDFMTRAEIAQILFHLLSK